MSADDDLQFFLGTQGLNHPSSMLEQPGSSQPNFDLPLMAQGTGQIEKRISNSVLPRNDLFEIKEDKEVEQQNTPTPVAERKQTTTIAPAAKWVAPPKLKSKKQKQREAAKAGKTAAAPVPPKPMF